MGVAALGQPLVSGCIGVALPCGSAVGGRLALSTSDGGRNRGSRSVVARWAQCTMGIVSPGPAVHERWRRSVGGSLARGRPDSGPKIGLHFRSMRAHKLHARCPIAGPSQSHHDMTRQVHVQAQCHRLPRHPLATSITANAPLISPNPFLSTLTLDGHNLAVS